MALVEMLTESWWAPVLIALTITGSAVFPPLPSESMLVTATTLALQGELDLVLALLASMIGAVLADLTAYALGRGLGRRTRHHAHRSTRARNALRWLDDRQATWGTSLIIAGRFIPGGTTAVGLSAGVLGCPLPRFLGAALVGALLWTTYGLVLASLGRAFLPGSTWASVLLALALTLAIAGVIRVVSTIRSRRRRDRTTPPTDTSAEDQ